MRLSNSKEHVLSALKCVEKILPNLNFQQKLGTLCQWMGLIRFIKEDEDL